MPRNDTPGIIIDAFNIQLSSWTRWLNCARRQREENIMPYQCADRIYFIAMKNIYPGQELMFYYGDQYAETLDIHYEKL